MVSTHASARFASGVAVAAALMTWANCVYAQKTVGGFNATRAQVSAIDTGASFAGIRSDLANYFESVTYASTPTLTAAFLSSVNVLVLGVAQTTSNGTIPPLTAAEQSALVAFVNAGGNALLLTDNGFYNVPSNSFVQPFGLGSDGVFSCTGNGQATVLPLPCNWINGFFGSTATLDDDCYNGWYPTTGSATVLARWSYNNQACVAMLSSGSGRVVFVSEYNLIDTTTPNDVAFRRNMLVLLGLRLHVSASATAVCQGHDITLQVPAATGPAGFQWRRNNAALSDGPTGSGSTLVGTAGNILTIRTAQVADTGSYDCMISIPCNSTSSDAISLSVFNLGNGDTNADQHIDGLDIQGFVQALLLGGANTAATCAADMNHDGAVTPADIPLFVAVLVS